MRNRNRLLLALLAIALLAQIALLPAPVRAADNGITWQQRYTGPANLYTPEDPVDPVWEVRGTINGIAFASPNDGWAVGQRTDTTPTVSTQSWVVRWNGSQWTSSTVEGSSQPLRAVCALDATHVWAVGNGGVILAWDGDVWNQQGAGVTSGPLYGVAFSDANHGWAVGANRQILTTSNGGNTWAVDGSSPSLAGKNLYAVSAVPGMRAWAVGDGGATYRFNGSAWVAGSGAPARPLRGVSFSDADHGWAVGDENAFAVTTNGGATWTAQSAPVLPGSPTSDMNPRAVAFTNPRFGVAVGLAEVTWRTTDGGNTWKVAQLGEFVGQGGNVDLSAVAFDRTAASNPWAVGSITNDLPDAHHGYIYSGTWSITPPAAPTGLTVQQGGTGAQTELQWTDNASDEVTYTVERSTDNTSSFSEVAALPADSAAFEDTPGDFGHTYYYRVQCSNRAGSSGWSDIASVLLESGVSAPVSNDDTATIARDTTLSVDAPGGVLRNDTGSSLTAAWVSGPSHGTLSLAADGGYTYRPASYTGTDTFRYRAIAGTLSSSPATVTITVTPGPATAPKVDRVAGTDRYAVAANIARKGWDPVGDKTWPGVTDVIVACGEAGKEADPLAAAGLAGVYNAPVLLTKIGSLPSVTRGVIAEIAAKRVVTVHLIGGTVSVPDARWTDILRISSRVSRAKDRISGADRYAVTANIAKQMVKHVSGGAASIPGVLFVCSENPAAFFDALAASPIAYAQHMPMLGVRKYSIPTSVKSEMNGELVGKDRYIVSSSAYIANGVVPLAKPRLTNSSNRYTAATDIANSAIVTNPWLTASDVGVAAKLPDALTGGTFMGKKGGVLLFTDSSGNLQSTTGTWITKNKSAISQGWIFGGTTSVPLGQETQFRNKLP